MIDEKLLNNQEIIELYNIYELDSSKSIEFTKLLDMYLEEFHDNKVLYNILKDDFVTYKYSYKELSIDNLISFLRSIINYGNKFNLSNKDYLSDNQNGFQVIFSSIYCFDFISGFKTTEISDHRLFNDLINILMKVQSNQAIPYLLRELFLISIYKNINLLNYEIDVNYQDIYLKVFNLYTNFIHDPYINDFIMNNGLNIYNNINKYDMNILFDFIDNYVRDEIENKDKKAIKR